MDASKGAAKLKGELSGKDDHGLVPDAGRDRMKSLMRLVEGVAFYKRGDVWVQADLPAKPKIEEVEAFSEEYFDLITKDPKIGKFLALGRVDFVWDGVVYKIR